MNGYGRMCLSGGMFLKEWQVTDKIIGLLFIVWIFSNLHSTFYEWLKLKK